MRKSGPSYNCMTGPDKNGCGKVSCSTRALDQLVTDAVLTRYATDPAASPTVSDLTAAPTNEPETNGETNPGVAELAALFAEGRLSHAAWRVVQSGIDATPPAARMSPARPDAELRSAWEHLPLHRRRERISHLIDEVVVSPTAKRGSTFDTGRVKLLWRPLQGPTKPGE